MSGLERLAIQEVIKLIGCVIHDLGASYKVTEKLLEAERWLVQICDQKVGD